MSAQARKAQASGVPWRLIGWGGAAVLLLLPWIVGAPWTLSDFVLAGTVFALVGGVFELAVRTTRNISYRGGIATLLAASFLLVWINGAVGIIGSEDNPANLMFGGVLLVAIAGAFVARFRAEGMARAMIAAALAQALVGAIALAGGLSANEPSGTVGVLAINAFFIALWLAAAWLFRRSAREQAAE